MISTRIKKGKNGKSYIIEKYRKEPSGLYKVEKINNSHNIIEKVISYYKDHPGFLVKEIVFYNDTKAIKVISCFLDKNTSGKTHTIQEINDEEAIVITTYFKNHKENAKCEILFKNITGIVYKREILYNENEFYFIRSVDYFINYDNKLLEREEIYYKKHPEGLSKVIQYNNPYGKKQKILQYYENHKKTLYKVEKFFDNEILVKEVQYFSNHPLNPRIAKAEAVYENNRIVNFKTFDKDGIEFDYKEKSF